MVRRFATETPLQRAKASCFVTGGFEDDVMKIWAQQLGGIIKIQNSRKNGTNVGYAVTKDDAKDVRMRHSLFKVCCFFCLTNHRINRCRSLNNRLQPLLRRKYCPLPKNVRARTPLRLSRKVRRDLYDVCLRIAK